MSGRAFGRLLAAPAAVLLLAVGVAPLCHAVWTALHTFSPDPSAPTAFYGLGNLRDLLADPQFRQMAWTTAVMVAVSVSLQLVLGCVLALALHGIARGRGTILSLLLIPSALAPIVGGIAWWMLFNTRFGPINALLGLVGIEPIEWTVRMPWALVAIIVAAVWQWTPFAAVVLLGGLTTVPENVLEAARIDGARGLRLFWHVTLPHLRPFILVAGLVLIIEASRMYELPYFITQGGPGNATVVGGVYLLKLTRDYFDLGRASMMSLLYVAALTLLAAAYVRVVAGRSAPPPRIAR